MARAATGAPDLALAATHLALAATHLAVAATTLALGPSGIALARPVARGLALAATAEMGGGRGDRDRCRRTSLVDGVGVEP